jgi:hypothetical protein
MCTGLIALLTLRFGFKKLVAAVATLGDAWNTLLQATGCIHHQLTATLHRTRQAMYVPVI